VVQFSNFKCVANLNSKKKEKKKHFLALERIDVILKLFRTDMLLLRLYSNAAVEAKTI